MSLFATPCATGKGLRPYQQEAVDAVLAELSGETQGTLLLCATGTGKTQMAVEVMARWIERDRAARVLFLAHRDELIQQASRRISGMLDFVCDVEQAQNRDGRQSAIVVGSVQTLCRESRRRAHRPDAFSLIVVDEAHHAAADGYLRILNHFTAAKRLGLTATATRADGKKLGADWESVAYEYPIRKAIADGYLVPIRRKAIRVESLRLDGVATRGGDLAAGDLEAKVLENEATIHSWARGILDAAGARKTMAFCPGVESSRRLAEVLNRYRPDSAVHLDGESDRDERRMQLARYAKGEYQYLANCGLFLEGFDEPSIACVAMCRPTKSPSLYVQMLGRGTRLAPPGKVDLLVLDFTSNSIRHDIVTAVDVLCDGESDEVTAGTAQELGADPSLTVEQAIGRAKARADAKAKHAAEEAERRRTEAQRAHVRAKAQTITWDVDGTDAFLGVDARAAAHNGKRFGGRPLSPKQRAMVEKAYGKTNQDTDAGMALDRDRFNGLIARTTAKLCTLPQGKAIQRHGIDPTGVTFAAASAILNALAAVGWHPSPTERDRIADLARPHERQPGEEG